MPCYAMLSATRVEDGIAGDAPRVPKRRRGVGGGEEARANVKPAATLQQGRKRHERRELLHLWLSVLGEELLQAEPDFTFLLAHTVPLQLV